MSVNRITSVISRFITTTCVFNYMRWYCTLSVLSRSRASTCVRRTIPLHSSSTRSSMQTYVRTFHVLNSSNTLIISRVFILLLRCSISYVIINDQFDGAIIRVYWACCAVYRVTSSSCLWCLQLHRLIVVDDEQHRRVEGVVSVSDVVQFIVQYNSPTPTPTGSSCNVNHHRYYSLLLDLVFYTLVDIYSMYARGNKIHRPTCVSIIRSKNRM